MVHLDPSFMLGRNEARNLMTGKAAMLKKKAGEDMPRADCHIFLDYGSTRIKVGLLWKPESAQHVKQLANGNLVDFSNFHLRFPGPNRDRAPDLPPSAVRITQHGESSTNLKAAIAWNSQTVPAEGKPSCLLTHFKYQMRSDDCSPLRNISDNELLQLEKTFGNDDIANYESIMTMVLTSLLHDIKQHADAKGPAFPLRSVSWTCTTPPPFEDNIVRQFQYAVETATKKAELKLVHYRPKSHPFPFENLQESYCAGVSYAWWQKGQREAKGLDTRLEEQVVVVIDGGGMSTHCGACRIDDRSTEQTEFWVDYLPRGQETLFNAILSKLLAANQGKVISQDAFINMMLRASIKEKARGVAEISSIDEATVIEIVTNGYKDHAEALANWAQDHLVQWERKRVAEGSSLDVTIAFSGGFMRDTVLIDLLKLLLRQVPLQKLTFDNVAEGTFNVLHGAMIHHLSRGRRAKEAVFEHSYGHYGTQYNLLKPGEDPEKPRITIKSGEHKCINQEYRHIWTFTLKDGVTGHRSGDVRKEITWYRFKEKPDGNGDPQGRMFYKLSLGWQDWMDTYIVRKNVKPLHEADSGRHVEMWSCMKFSEENIVFTVAVVLQKELSEEHKKKYIDCSNPRVWLLDARTLCIREVTAKWSDLRIKDANFGDA